MECVVNPARGQVWPFWPMVMVKAWTRDTMWWVENRAKGQQMQAMGRRTEWVNCKRGEDGYRAELWSLFLWAVWG